MSNVNVQHLQTQHLFILVGANPLPNYVAAKLLLKSGEHQSSDHQSNGHLYLVHTSETGAIADRLIAALKLELQKTATKILVDEANTKDTVKEIKKYVEGKQDVGLNYTGGTKTMAVHAYQAVKEACPGAVFSYLDAKTLSLFIEKNGQNRNISVARALHLSLPDMLSLHGYSLPRDDDDVRKVPVQPEICTALANVHSKADAFKQWREWCSQERLDNLPDPSRYALLEDVINAFHRLGNGSATPTLVAQALNPKWTSLEQCRKWFLGDWLEEYVLWACIQAKCKDKNLFDDFGIDLQPQSPKKRAFQFDVAIVRGYQLFAISCIASEKKEKCKEHLFEAYIRARQMGGEEARVGLVCCAPENNPDSSPSVIQTEIEESWDAQGKVRVFGAEHLPNLPEHLQDWFNSQP